MAYHIMANFWIAMTPELLTHRGYVFFIVFLVYLMHPSTLLNILHS